MNRSRPLATGAPTEADPVSVTLASGSKYRSHILAAAHDLDARGETDNAEATLERHATVVRLTTVTEAREVRDAAIHALNRGRHPGGATTRRSIKRVRDEAADAVAAHERAMSRTRDPDDMPADPMDRSASDYDADDCLPDGGERDDGARLTDDGIDLADALVSIEDYRHEDHIEVVAETDDRVVVRDSAGYELSEWADDLGISRRDLSGRMHDLAREHYGREKVPSGGDPWCASDPLVLAKPDDDSDDDHRLIADGGVDTGGRHVDMAPAEPMEEPRAVPHDETERVPTWARNAAVAIEREADASFIKFHVTRAHVYVYFDLEKRYISERFLPDGVRILGVGHPGSAGGSIKLKLSQPD